ncbi:MULTISPECIES: helix-turn-helix domain-containing protein [Streptomyces]|uniref:Transcriptional regulator n=2 Tax=Streptomyces TaxID=1883 RepID=A0A3R7LJL1_9ACTN|nr:MULTISPECIES: helix-turn-helix domain-containing protein [Streptomyces]KNE82540.1 transcriptional regulator [Streptomyces fradiae]OFA52010.1 transcriptional regulator [Streptomyces fradiae]PQM23098.1 transcriptional regulator [Streptomyces xinghaiensis]RKM91463.1 transcriptional regulator [Streptomyces xinghaiensis]RNC74900.1 transcriptional regulator [Streptomyces xinghaiensis]
MSHRSDLRQRRATLEGEWSRLVPRLKAAGSPPPGGEALRHEVTESWARSLTSVDPARDSAPVTDGGAVHHRWTGSPLRRPVNDLADELRSVADDAGFVTAIADESGTILWTCGGQTMRRRAERVNFAPGGRWDEQAMGTNALSLALRTDRPSTVFSAEHLVTALHGWVCYCAPIHGPDGSVLGVLDLSTTWDRSHPLAMSTVRGLVSAIEVGLRTTEPPRQQPGADLPRVHLTCMGEEKAVREGVSLPLRPRQLEILTLLALEPDGFSPERLRAALYGDRPVTASTFKAEISHLRRALGGGVATRRYALTAPVSCDAVDVQRALEHTDTETALRLYRGPLLPRSEAPGIEEWRTRLEVAVREAVLASTRPEHALRYGERAPYDAEVHEHALRLIGPGDARRALAAGRLTTALR